MQGGLSLDVRREDLGMTTEVYEEGVTPPSAFDLDDVEGNITKEVF